jgi:membrane protease YdiL (CAAX protease family)
MYNGKNPDDTSTYFFKFIEFLIFFICIIFLLTIIGVFFVDKISGKYEPDILLFFTTSISTLIFMFYSKRFETIFKTIFFGFLDLKWKRLTRVISIIISLYCVINFFETGEPLIISFVTLLVIFLVSWICKPFFEESDSTKMAKLEKNLSLDAQRDIKKLKDLEGDFEN